MKYAVLIVRILLGLMFAVFGSNAFLHFIPMPEMNGDSGAFIGAIARSGYIYAIGACQVIGGLLLLIGGRLTGLGLTVLGPIIVKLQSVAQTGSLLCRRLAVGKPEPTH